MRIFSALFLFLSLSSFADDSCLLGKEEISPELTAAMLSLPRDSFALNCPKRDPYPDLFEGVTTMKALKAAVEKKTSELGLTAKWKNNRGSGSWKEFSETPEDVVRLKRIANVTLGAMNLYPKALFKKVDLEKLYFVKDLKVAGQLRKAMPDPTKDNLVYADNSDVVCPVGMENRVHHEFYHYIEARLSGSMRARERVWQGMNKPDFKYGDGGQEVYNCAGGFRNTGHVKEGFVSRYALSAEEEDKAEMFGWIMTKGFANQVQGWTETDPVLKQKRERMIKFISDAVPEMNAEFFNKFSAE